MRKMTKTVATLAAMSAMTVASASLAFAAEKQVEGLTGGTWSAQANGSWKYKSEAGVQLKDTWAEIDGVWYYFKGETMAQDDFLVLDDKGYFFDGNGRLATGWQKISSKMDAYGDLSISEKLYYPTNNGYETVSDTYEYDYHDFVWCYFDENGVAKENEWFQDPASGRWYYFDENVMVKNVFNYTVAPDNYDVTKSDTTKYYGFDENGAMMTGWNSKKSKATWNNPTKADNGEVWYYYKGNGQMQKAGWAEIDGDWYLFANKDADGLTNVADPDWVYGGYPLIVNSYVASYKNNKDVEYFFVDKTGKLQSGVQNVKKAWKVLFYNESSAGKAGNVRVAYEEENVKDTDIWVNFSGNGFSAKKGVKDNNYYALSDTNVFGTAFGTDADNVTEINNKLYDATYFFTNYDSFTNPNWDFTDAGVASQTSVDAEADADEEIVDYITAGNYVNRTTFELLSKNDYENNLYVNQTDVVLNTGSKGSGKAAHENDRTDYFVMVDTASAEIARRDAEAAHDFIDVAYVSAYDPVSGTKKALANAKTAWETARDTSMDAYVVSVTGNAAVAPDLVNFVAGAGGIYEDLVDKLTAAKNAEDTARENYNLALSLGSSNVATLKTALDNAVAVTKEWQKAVDSQEADALYAATVANTGSGKPYTLYQEAIEDHNVAEAEYNAAVAEYNAAKRAALAYERSSFVNKWDVAFETDETNFAVVGERVKNAFIAQDTDKLYMVDADGKLVTNKAVLIDDTANIVHKDYITGVGTRTYNNAYLVFGSDGTATVGYTDTKKTITIGGVSYWSTDKTVTIGKATATIFVANKQYNSQY